METNNVVPFRPMIANRNTNVCHFYKFDDFDASLNDIFTTRHIELDIDEYTPFILRNPTTSLMYDVNGVQIHYVNDIIKPIYDKIIMDLLNPISQMYIRTNDIPMEVSYDPSKAVVMCKTLRSMALSASNTIIYKSQPKHFTGGRHRIRRHRRTKKNRKIR
jgi:hypothetical protein